VPAPPESRVRSEHAAATFRAFLERAARRVTLIAAAQGAAVGLGIAAVIALVARTIRVSTTTALLIGALVVLLGAAIGLVVAARRRRRIAMLVERGAPQSRNLIVTAAELMDAPPSIRPEVRSLVLDRATRVVGELEPARLFPAGRALVAVGAGALLWALGLILIDARPAASARPLDVPLEEVAISDIAVTVSPPAYAGRAAQAIDDPSRIEALAGSRIVLTVSGTAAAMNIETVAGRRSLAVNGGAFTGEVIADADGFIAIEPVPSDGRPGARRLIGLSVIPDRVPRVRVTAPGRDLFLTDARRTLALAVEADDDIALASLTLRYTRVSGSGERFTFIDGETPLTITRTDARTWTARGTLALGALDLEPGDVVVYRGVATDRRPGATPTESDAFIVEITSPGAVASEGFAVDDELDRNAVSQQMVILKTERLLERRRSMTEEAFVEEAMTLAAEQRRVRAEFVFMMGGELAQEVTGDETGISELHEEEEAEASDDILAGRLANRGRVEIVRAIRAMSDAATLLTAKQVDSALVDEKLALEHLQRAFSRTRYILRALTLRERLDLTRRLSGSLVDAGRDVRSRMEIDVDSAVGVLRRALAEIGELAGTEGMGAADGARASVIAQDVLSVDPSSDALQEIAGVMSDAANAISRGREAEARGLLDRSAIGLGAVVRESLIEAPSRPASGDARRLNGALSDALRRAGVPR